MIKRTKDPLCKIPIVVAACGPSDLAPGIRKAGVKGVELAVDRPLEGCAWHLVDNDGTRGDMIVIWINTDCWDKKTGPATVAHECFHALIMVADSMVGGQSIDVRFDNNEHEAYHLDNIYQIVWDVVQQAIAEEA